MSKIAVFAGSARKDSWNKKLAILAAQQLGNLGAHVTLIDLADYPMPIYDGDAESSDGIPAKAHDLRDLLAEHDGLLIACPEYNGSITPLLKNTIDWLSRPAEGVPMMAAFRGKVAGLVSASPGALGGLRGLVHVRAILSGIGVLVVPQDASIASAHNAFNQDGTLLDEQHAKRLTATLESLLHTTDRILG